MLLLYPFMKGLRLLLLCFIMVIFITNHTSGQCAITLVAPITEDFETSDGGWVASSNTHWNWGVISPGTKLGITAAASGQRCWIAGSLSSTGYQGGVSYLNSPCYDVSSLLNPTISFSVFWETENSWDGVRLEYTIDNGMTWNSLGSDASNNNCEAVNWYNASNIRYIGRVPGWTGSSLTGDCARTNGSGQWLTAKFNLKNISISSFIQFRFVFGAGTQCNSYDGFAIDDFSITEGVATTGGYIYSCVGNSTIQFTASNSFCTTGVEWNFGDVTSPDNTSNSSNVTHQFSAPGTYHVKLIQHFSATPDITTEKDVVVLGVSLQITQPILCNGNHTGSINSIVTGSAPPFQYAWSNNATSNTLNNVTAGNYSVTVSQGNACPANASLLISEPAKLQLDTLVKNATCNQNNGSIQVVVHGGISPYSILWSNGATMASINNLSFYKKYLLTVTDANLCVAKTDSIYIDNIIIPAQPHLGRDTTICVWQQLMLNPGNFRSYLWQNHSQSPIFVVKDSGTYYVEVTNQYGCSATDSIHVLVDCRGIIEFPNAFAPRNNNTNHTFGPIGDLSVLNDFSMVIYNRWGQIIFKSNNPYQKWDGMYEGKKSNVETFVWMASYRILQSPVIKKKGAVVALY